MAVFWVTALIVLMAKAARTIEMTVNFYHASWLSFSGNTLLQFTLSLSMKHSISLDLWLSLT
jgi:hypothetical protein